MLMLNAGAVLKSKKITLGIITFWLSFSLCALEPLTENDMDGVSANIGANLLNLLSVAGKPAAGLDTNYLNTESTNNDEQAKDLAGDELRSQEERTVDQESELQASEIVEDDSGIIEAALSAQVRTVGRAELLGTTSEIQFTDEQFTHTFTKLEDGGVKIVRDLSIDLLKLENLRGGDPDNTTTYGNLYLSNWVSQGSTITHER